MWLGLKDLSPSDLSPNYLVKFSSLKKPEPEYEARSMKPEV
jgi:hypothetical protein